MKKTKITRRVLSALLATVFLIGCFALSYSALAATSITRVNVSVVGLYAGHVPSASDCKSLTRGTGVASVSTEVKSGNTFKATTAPLEVGKSYRLLIEIETTGAYYFPELSVTASVNGDSLYTGVLWRSSYHITVVYAFSVTASTINRIVVSIPTLSIGDKCPSISSINVSYGVEPFYIIQKRKTDE